jgi:lipoate-protein ligase A
VLGYGKKFESEVFREGCAELDIPILRRSSGGGTVLQGPGSLNYTLVLPISNDSELESITGANRFIMERNRNALAALTDFPITIQGCTDLTVHSQKFSGNAQRRKKRCLLFHGAFLLDFELELINRTLRLPVQQPEYRAHRSHSEFLTNLPLDRAKVRDALIGEWNGTSIVETTTSNNVLIVTNDLARSRYSSTEWNQRF